MPTGANCSQRQIPALRTWIAIAHVDHRFETTDSGYGTLYLQETDFLQISATAICSC